MIYDSSVALRLPKMEDSECFARLRNDIATQTSLMDLPRVNTNLQMDDWVEEISRESSSLFFAIAWNVSNTAIGFVQLRRMDFIHSHAEIGIGFDQFRLSKRDKEKYNPGPQALELIEQHAYKMFRIRKLMARVLRSDLAAIGLYKQCGYIHVGTLHKHYYPAGAYHDVIIMEHFLEQVKEQEPA